MYYSEKQAFKYSMKWYIVSAVLLLMIVGMLLILLFNMNELDNAVLVILILIPIMLVGIFSYVSSLELSIKIAKDHLSYRLVPIFNEWKHISSSDIHSFEVKNLSASHQMTPQAQGKINWIGKHKRYVLLGKSFLALQLAENSKVTLSTLDGEKIKLAMQELMNRQ
jgi:hypothetical protein